MLGSSDKQDSDYEGLPSKRHLQISLHSRVKHDDVVTSTKGTQVWPCVNMSTEGSILV